MTALAALLRHVHGGAVLDAHGSWGVHELALALGLPRAEVEAAQRAALDGGLVTVDHSRWVGSWHPLTLTAEGRAVRENRPLTAPAS